MPYVCTVAAVPASKERKPERKAAQKAALMRSEWIEEERASDVTPRRHSPPRSVHWLLRTIRELR